MKKKESWIVPLLATAVLGFVGWVGDGIWNVTKETHDLLIVHTITINDIQSDMKDVKAKLALTPTREEVNRRIANMRPTIPTDYHPNGGGGGIELTNK